jgi:hypothetical protein
MKKLVSVYLQSSSIIIAFNALFSFVDHSTDCYMNCLEKECVDGNTLLFQVLLNQEHPC